MTAETKRISLTWEQAGWSFRAGSPDGPRDRDRRRQRRRARADAHAAAGRRGLQRLRCGLHPRRRCGCRRKSSGSRPAASGGRRSRAATPRSTSTTTFRRTAGRGPGPPRHRPVAGEVLLGHRLARPRHRHHAMGLRWLSAAAALAAAAPAGAQQVKEIGVQATGTLSDPALGVAGVYGAWRPSARGRVSAALGVGVSDGDAAWRGELLGHFLLAPRREERVGGVPGGRPGGRRGAGGSGLSGAGAGDRGATRGPPAAGSRKRASGGGARLSRGLPLALVPRWWRAGRHEKAPRGGSPRGAASVRY